MTARTDLDPYDILADLTTEDGLTTNALPSVAAGLARKDDEHPLWVSLQTALTQIDGQTFELRATKERKATTKEEVGCVCTEARVMHDASEDDDMILLVCGDCGSIPVWHLSTVARLASGDFPSKGNAQFGVVGTVKRKKVRRTYTDARKFLLDQSLEGWSIVSATKADVPGALFANDELQIKIA